jgi:hypothetical protein
MAYPQEVLADNPVAYWRFEEGDELEDEVGDHDFESGEFADVLEQGLPILTRRWDGAAAGFTGGTDSAKTPDETYPFGNWPIGGEISVEMLVRPRTSNGIEVLVSHAFAYGDAGHVQGWEVWLEDGAPVWRVGNQVFLSSASQPNMVVGPVLRPYRWHHLVFVYTSNGVFAPGEIAIWVDGEVVATESTNGQYFSDRHLIAINTARGVWVGRSTEDRDSLESDIDEVAIYGSALSEERVLAHWAASGLGGLDMPERATVYEDAIWRVEDSPGTPGAGALYRLPTTDVDMNDEVNRRIYRKRGNKFSTSSSKGKGHSSGTVTGDQSINDVLFLMRGLVTKGEAAATPANNGVWAVGIGAASAGTFTLTYGGQTTATIAYTANAALVQTRLEALSSLGPGNVEVTGAAPSWVVRIRGYAAGDPGALTIDGAGLTDGTPTSASNAGGTARRWTLTSLNATADDPQTYEIQKGATGIDDAAADYLQTFVSGLRFKWNVNEASFTGDLFADVGEEPFTMEEDDITELPVVPVDPECISVWLGLGLTGANAPAKLERLLDLEMDLTGKWNPLKTLNCDDPGITAGVETAPTAMVRFIVEHDEQGIGIRQEMLDGDVHYMVFEATCNDINTYYAHRWWWVVGLEITAAPHQDTDGVYSTQYEGTIRYSAPLGAAMVHVFDTTIASF